MKTYSTETVYKGQGRCVTTHLASGREFGTDLHKDIGGLEEYPAPGEMLAATLASCMMSMISFVASRKDVDVTGMKLSAVPVVQDGQISKIELCATMPLPADHPLRKMLEASALTCPVHNTLREGLETPIEWNWVG